jgi:hypothetical protein
MVEMERAAGEVVLVGPYTPRVLAVRQDEVVGALDGPGHAGDRDELTAAGRDRGAGPADLSAPPCRSGRQRAGPAGAGVEGRWLSRFREPYQPSLQDRRRGGVGLKCCEGLPRPPDGIPGPLPGCSRSLAGEQVSAGVVALFRQYLLHPHHPGFRRPWRGGEGDGRRPGG